jgi:hypothetical protein
MISGKMRVAIVKTVKAADPTTTTVTEIWKKVLKEVEEPVSYTTVWKVVASTGVQLAGKSAAARELITRLHADPEFAAAHAERSRERMTRLNAERMTRLHADPEFEAKRIAAIRATAARRRAAKNGADPSNG